jgi:hypothetical protein
MRPNEVQPPHGDWPLHLIFRRRQVEHAKRILFVPCCFVINFSISLIVFDIEISRHGTQKSFFLKCSTMCVYKKNGIRDFRERSGLLQYLHIQLGEEDIDLDKCRIGSRWKRVSCIKKDGQIVGEKGLKIV